MRRIRKYKGLSLVEMLITIVIITTVILLASITLTTLIRTSAVTTARTSARQESEFVLELIRRNVRNSHSMDVHIYTVTNRKFDESTGRLTDTAAVQGYDVSLGEGEVGNEIHFRPYGYHRWVCIGYFPTTTDDTKGYIVKSSMVDSSNAASCLDGTTSDYAQNALILNSSDVYANLFNISYYNSPSGNLLMTASVQMKSKYEMSFSRNVKPVYFKQALISTQKLTWE